MAAVVHTGPELKIKTNCQTGQNYQIRQKISTFAKLRDENIHRYNQMCFRNKKESQFKKDVGSDPISF